MGTPPLAFVKILASTRSKQLQSRMIRTILLKNFQLSNPSILIVFIIGLGTWEIRMIMSIENLLPQSLRLASPVILKRILRA